MVFKSVNLNKIIELGSSTNKLHVAPVEYYNN